MAAPVLVAAQASISANESGTYLHYLPDFAYERKSLNTEVSLAELRKRGQIASRAKEVGLGPEFSTAIRQGVPMPD